MEKSGWNPGTAASVHRAALLRVLSRYAWTHSFDQSWQADPREPKGIAASIHYYAGMLASLPSEIRPEYAWVVAEPHPTSGRMHGHGFWAMGSARLFDGWWRSAKEYLGEMYGWSRIWPFHSDTQLELAEHIKYPTGHHIKKAPTRFWTRMAIIAITSDHESVRRVRYMWRGFWMFRVWCAGVLTKPMREV